MSEVKFGQVEDANGDENSVRSDCDLTERGPEMQKVVIEVRSNCFPHMSTWMTPNQAREFANKIRAAAEHAEAVNQESAREAAEFAAEYGSK